MTPDAHDSLDLYGNIYLVIALLGAVILVVLAFSEWDSARSQVVEAARSLHNTLGWMYLGGAAATAFSGFLTKALLRWLSDVYRMLVNTNRNLERLHGTLNPVQPLQHKQGLQHTKKAPPKRAAGGPHIIEKPWGGQECSECHRNLPASEDPYKNCPHCGTTYTE